MKKKILAVLIIAIMAFCNVSGAFSAEAGKGGEDETVYVMLKNDGGVDYIKLVSRLQGNSLSGEYRDEVVKDKELPVILNFKYCINDAEVPASKLTGSSGEFKILIGVKQNASCAEELKDKYMAQIQLPLNLDCVKIKKFDGATSVITGATANLSYAVLPGEDASFELVFDADNFEMDSIQIVLVEYSSDFTDQFGGFVDGIHTMGEKAGEMIDGTKELKTGMEKLSDGAVQLDDGVEKVDNGALSLSKGMKSFSNGMKQYQAGLAAAAAGIDSSYMGLQQINAGTAPIIKGYGDLQGAVEQLSQNHNNLVMLAQKLQSSSKDPEIQMLCQGIIAEAEGLKQISAGMEQANQGLQGFAGGIEKLEAGAETLNQGAAALPAGFEQLQTGFDGLQSGAGKLAAGLGELRKGTSSMAASAVKIPQEVQKLVDGQVKFRDGISEMETRVKEGISPEKKPETVSFKDGKTKVKSLQFIMKTPELKRTDSSSDGTEITVEKLSWFQKIWDRLKDLF